MKKVNLEVYLQETKRFVRSCWIPPDDGEIFVPQTFIWNHHTLNNSIGRFQRWSTSGLLNGGPTVFVLISGDLFIKHIVAHLFYA